MSKIALCVLHVTTDDPHPCFSLAGSEYLLGRIGLEVTLGWELQEPGRGFFSPGNDREEGTLGLPPSDFVPPEAEVNCVAFISSLELRRGRELNSWLPDCCFTMATAAYTKDTTSILNHIDTAGHF